MKIIVLIIMLITLITFIAIIACKNRYDKVKYYDFGDVNASIKICLIAGVHGNEPAASLLLTRLIEDGYFVKKCSGRFIRVIPSVNEFGLKHNIRYQSSLWYPDLNRSFTENGAFHSLSNHLIDLTRDMTLVIDFHEGWGYHLATPRSIGSTMTVTGDEMTQLLSDQMVKNINQTISDPFKKFVKLGNPCDIKYTFSCYSHLQHKNYILVETTGQGNVQPLSIRQNQILIILDTLF